MPSSNSARTALSNRATKLWATLNPKRTRTIEWLQQEFGKDEPPPLIVWHRLGRLAGKLAPKGSQSYGRQGVQALAELIGLPPNRIYQARKFAKSYSASDVADLKGLTWLHIIDLLGVEDEEQRRKFQAECLKKKWTTGKLQREIRSRVGRQRSRGRGGRPSRRPQSLPEALADLDRLLSSIVHWYRGFERAAASEAADAPRRKRSRKVTFDIEQFPPDLRTRLPAAIRSLEDLLIHVEGARDALVGRTDS
jgi:hypothetical protein